jgi:hypothetical protein
MIEVIVILGSLLFISLSVLSVLSVKVRALKNNVKKLSVAYSKIENLMSSQTKLDNDAHQESFIKFLSDSRDSAFDYIEEVQSGISDFVLEVDPLINYFDEYGDVMGMVPNYDNMKKISVEFKKLKKLLPEESK